MRMRKRLSIMLCVKVKVALEEAMRTQRGRKKFPPLFFVFCLYCILSCSFCLAFSLLSLITTQHPSPRPDLHLFVFSLCTFIIFFCPGSCLLPLLSNTHNKNFHAPCGAFICFCSLYFIYTYLF